MTVTTITPPDTPLNRAWAQGHRNRMGHVLDGVLTSQEEEVWFQVALCCGEKVGVE